MIPAHMITNMRDEYDEVLGEAVSISRPMDTVNYLGVPNTDEYEVVTGLESVICRFVASGNSMRASMALDEGMADINLDTLSACFPEGTDLQIGDLITRGDLLYRVLGIMDNHSDLIGVDATVKRIREERS